MVAPNRSRTQPGPNVVGVAKPKPGGHNVLTNEKRNKELREQIRRQSGLFDGPKRYFAREDTRPSIIRKFIVTSNEDPTLTASLAEGMVRFEYHEGIFQDSIRATCIFTDSGNTTNNKLPDSNCKNTGTAVDMLPIVGSEKVEISVESPSKEKIDLEMYVNKVVTIEKTTTNTTYALDLASIEFLKNEVERCFEKYTGAISGNVEKILRETLKTNKKLFIEDTKNSYVRLGNSDKAFYTINKLSTGAIPNTTGSDEKTAGYFFFETSKGFYFRSIDKMFAGRFLQSLRGPKLKIIYNASTDATSDDIPKGYDVKALEFFQSNAIDVGDVCKTGGKSNEVMTFNPYNCEFESKISTVEAFSGGYELAGENLPKYNPEVFEESFGKVSFYVKDTGTTSDSTDVDQQLEKKTEENFDVDKVWAQLTTRYNMMISAVSTVTLPGIFKLNAGDMVFLDSPELKADPKTDTVDKQSGGKYIILDLAHLITPQGTFTKLNLGRDSFGRKIEAKSTDRYRIDRGSL